MPLDVPDKKDLDDETDEGFAMLARILIDETEDPVVAEEEISEAEELHDEDWVDEEEVERLMGLMEVDSN